MAERPVHRPEDFFDVAAYQELEARSEVRHELVGGRVVATAGGTRAHDQAAYYVTTRFAPFAEDGCAVFPHNRRLRVGSSFYYPDVFVHCGPPGHDLYEDDAVVVVEVLSPDSRWRDRREKAAAYSRLPSLRAYLVVDPDQPRIEVYAPEGGEWTWRVDGPGSAVDLGKAVVDVDLLWAWVQTHS